MIWVNKRPWIAVTGPERSSIPAWFFIWLQIWWAGGRAIYLKPNTDLPRQKVSGLILGGGADIDPVRYREKVLPTLKQESRQVRHKNRHFLIPVFVWLFRKIFSLEFTTLKEDQKRDELEFNLLKNLIPQRLPILGICRGAQVLNVYFGGTLHQEIADFYTEQVHLHTILPQSTVLIEPDSKLCNILKTKHVRVNSLHHQSVKTLGDSLKIVAQEPGGVVEAIEHTELPFVIGVQWHPEFLITFRRQRRLFEALVREARKAEPVSLMMDSKVSAGA